MFLQYGSGVFQDCSKLKKVFISKKVVNIKDSWGRASFGDEAGPFWGCSSDLQIYTDAQSANPGWANKWNYYSDEGELTVNYGVSLEQFNTLD